jgi:type IV pilus assembly protein PilN
VASSLLLVAAALFVGWWYWSLQQESADLDQRITDAQLEVQRLQSIILQVEQFEAQRAQLQQRVTLIEELRRGQSGPVHLLDAVSRALPESMWLIEMSQQDDEVMIEGRCTSLTSLSDFVANLEAEEYFQQPVEIVDSQVEPGTQAATELIRFTVRAVFVRPTT